MAQLKDLERDLKAALAREDFDQIASVRRTIAEQFPDTPAGGEASYKLGLDLLFRQKDLAGAAECFRAATKVKGEWLTPARTSLGVVLYRQGKHQQGAFELRKVATTAPPTLASALAWGLLVTFQRELRQTAEAERSRTEYLRVLTKLTEDKLEETKAMAHFLLGSEAKFEGDRPVAKKHLTAALALKALPQRERSLAEDALNEV